MQGSGGSMESLLLVVGHKIGLTELTGSTYEPT